MCGLTRVVAATDGETDPAEVLREKTRLSSRQAKRMARVAERLSEMPKVAEKFAEGDITLDHAAALANAADKVGPEAVEADPDLVGTWLTDNPTRYVLSVERGTGPTSKLIEAGVDILERQRRAREAKLWVDKDTGPRNAVREAARTPVRPPPASNRRPLPPTPTPRLNQTGRIPTRSAPPNSASPTSCTNSSPTAIRSHRRAPTHESTRGGQGVHPTDRHRSGRRG